MATTQLKRKWENQTKPMHYEAHNTKQRTHTNLRQEYETRVTATIHGAEKKEEKLNAAKEGCWIKEKNGALPLIVIICNVINIMTVAASQTWNTICCYVSW